VNSKVSMGLWGLAAFLSVGVAGYAYYFTPRGGAPSPELLGNLFARPWLMLHAALAGTALMIGPFQFLPAIRRRRALHRWLGRTYLVSCLVSGLAGLTLAFGATAGPIAGWGFGTLAVVWLFTTTQAYRMARAGRFDAHRQWMIRSFALTFAAVTLRLYLPFPPMMGFSFIEGYRAIAWLAWVPNLIAAELYIRRARARAVEAAPA
jgi:uncharacterized membrane protein